MAAHAVIGTDGKKDFETKGIFDRIKDALFTRHANAQTAPAPGAPPVAKAPEPVASPAGPSTAGPSAPVAPAPQATAPAAPAPSATPAAPASVDVASILDAAVKPSGQTLEWRRSIVDTMKALGLDSDLQSRKELAYELGYTGDTGDSETMNVWLQKALMKTLSENGGKVPAELMD